MKRKETITGHLLALVCIIAWGTSFLVSKNLMSAVSAPQLMLLRFTVAYAALWLLHPKWHFKWKEEALFLFIALFANTFYFLSENTALKLTQTSNVSILVTTAPIFSAVLLRIFGKGDRIGARQIVGFLIAFSGVILVVLNGVFHLKLRPAGDLLALAAALSWAVYGVLIRRYLNRFNNFLITRKLMFYGLITTIPIVLLERRPLAFDAVFSASGVLSLLYLGVICSAACYLMWNRAISDVGVWKTNNYMYAIPIVTLIAASLLLDETITPLGAAGVVLVIVGMVVSNSLKKTRGHD